ncbi:MAG: indolepyruvate ferredoxin oxidoreductase subunit alpha [Clostridiales bacterium]|nr:indolepyruvate ferredoxin oxidoreductase subunit alpha [Clostridiales bacterium]
MNELYLGNEAVARGAWEAGCTVTSAYPGTPSTEITEAVAKYDDIYSEWAPNEKVALEVGIGASFAGARTMVCMKHVGLNVAADPLFTASYTGVNGGLVIVVADDPGMHSSQNEQDSRYYAKAAHVPMLEPSSSQEAKEFTKLAFELSEKYDTPVLVRLTTRVSHSRGIVELLDRQTVELKEYKKDVKKYVMMPGMARGRHKIVEAREIQLQKDSNSMDINTVNINDKKMGVITSGLCYQYTKEALPDASVLKLGMVYPLPLKKIKDFASKVDKLYVVEELEPIIEETLKANGIDCIGKEIFTIQGEYSINLLKKAILGMDDQQIEGEKDLPIRPPIMCPGCPHRGAYFVMKKLKLIVNGDIGCYTLGALAPVSSMDTCVCMGASIGMAHGMEKAQGKDFSKKTVAIIGDSTFMHSGVTGLINVVYNDGNSTVIIVDNRTTGMTGHQNNPTNGMNIKGDPAYAIDIETLCKAIGVEFIKTIDPFDLDGFESGLKEALAYDGTSVIISKRECALLDKSKWEKPLVIDSDVCIGCKRCLKLGCPALVNDGNKVKIDKMLCVGCGLCMDVCPTGAIRRDV